jgi:hypothetical protein
MGIALPTFTAVEDSLLFTLYSRALDNRLPKPVLSTQRLMRLSASSITTSSNSRKQEFHPQRRTPSQEA